VRFAIKSHACKRVEPQCRNSLEYFFQRGAAMLRMLELLIEICIQASVRDPRPNEKRILSIAGIESFNC